MSAPAPAAIGLAAIGGRPIHGLVCIAGARGCGKTTRLQLMPRIYHDTLFVVRDNMGHWGESRRLYPSGNVRVIRHATGDEAALVAIKLAPAVLVLDEADVDMPAGVPLSGALKEIVQRGRQAKASPPYARRGPAGLLCAIREPVEIRTDFRRQVDYWLLGKCKDDPEAHAWFASKFGESMADRQSQLEWGQFIGVDKT